jgi:two-component system sporulation sensor kinase A
MSKSALLVEDNSSHVVLIGDELSAVLSGWTLDSVPTIAEARRRMAGHRYDLYVLDYMLPDGDGLTLLREIRSAGGPAPTLFVTTAASARVAVEAMKLGADDYIVKEEGYLAVLPYLVREVLDRYRLADERRGLEERLLRAERSATLGYLASGLAHHINNPLSTIRTFLQLLPTHLEDREFCTKYLGMALAETDRIRNLVLEIMRATTVPAEGQETLGLEEILARAEENVSEELKSKRVVCRRVLPPATPAIRVHGDAATCLFQTLLQNAVRFSPEGGEIEVGVTVDSDAGRVVTVVRDQGPGVPPEHRDKIFEPFFTTAVHGLGMGLFVASRIADLQNIQLSLETRPERGAAFRVALPMA